MNFLQNGDDILKKKAGFAIKWRHRLIGFPISVDKDTRTDEECHNTDIEKTTWNDSACLLGEIPLQTCWKKWDRHAWQKTKVKKKNEKEKNLLI